MDFLLVFLSSVLFTIWKWPLLHYKSTTLQDSQTEEMELMHYFALLLFCHTPTQYLFTSFMSCMSNLM